MTQSANILTYRRSGRQYPDILPQRTLIFMGNRDLVKKAEAVFQVNKQKGTARYRKYRKGDLSS